MSNVQLTELIQVWKKNAHPKITPVGSGHYNDVYEFSAGNKNYILRVAPDDSIPKLFYEVEMMHSEPPIHERVREKTDIPAPEIVFFDFSKKNFQRDFLITEKLPGREGGYDLRRLGEYVAQLHRIKGEGFGYPNRRFALGRSWPETFFEYVERIFSDCLRVKAIGQKEYDFFLEKYRQNRSALEECEPALLHLDLWFTNILTEDGVITAVLDFDRGMYGDVELEFAVLDTYASATPEFFAGYGHPRPRGEKAEKRKVMYLVYELIKYAFIRLARHHRPHVSRAHVDECLSLIEQL